MDKNPCARALDEPSATTANGEQVRFRREERHGEATLIVRGEIDISVADRFQEQLHELIEAAHSPAVIDLSALSFVDSSGLSALMSARKHAERKGVKLVLLAPSPFVRKVLDVTDLSSVFEVRD